MTPSILTSSEAFSCRVVKSAHFAFLRGTSLASLLKMSNTKFVSLNDIRAVEEAVTFWDCLESSGQFVRSESICGGVSQSLGGVGGRRSGSPAWFSFEVDCVGRLIQDSGMEMTRLRE